MTRSNVHATIMHGEACHDANPVDKVRRATTSESSLRLPRQVSEIGQHNLVLCSHGCVKSDAIVSILVSKRTSPSRIWQANYKEATY